MTEAIQTDRPTLTVKEVAALLELDDRTIYRAIQDGQLPVLEVGKKKLIPRLKLLALLGGDAA